MKESKKNNKNRKSKTTKEVKFSVEQSPRFENGQYVYFIEDISEQYKVVEQSTFPEYHQYMYSKYNINICNSAEYYCYLKYYSLLKPSTNELIITYESAIRPTRDTTVIGLEIKDIFSRLKTQEEKIKNLEASNMRLSMPLFSIMLLFILFYILFEIVYK